MKRLMILTKEGRLAKFSAPQPIRYIDGKKVDVKKAGARKPEAEKKISKEEALELLIYAKKLRCRNSSLSIGWKVDRP